MLELLISLINCWKADWRTEAALLMFKAVCIWQAVLPLAPSWAMDMAVRTLKGEKKILEDVER